MSDWNCIACKIEKIEKHIDADNLSIATVLGDYPVVIKTDQYKVSDMVGYFAIDTVVPDVEEFYFLCPKKYIKFEDDYGVVQQRQDGMKYELGQVPEKYRVIRAKRIRGVYSQGMLVDLKLFHNVGDSIVEEFGLKKVVEEEEENLPGLKKTRGTNAEKAPSGWSIPHYDIDGIRKYIACLREDEEIVLTEKLHGSNAAFSHDGERLWVKSRNYYKKMDPEDMWWDIALRYDLEKKLSFFPNLVFFGEVYGQIKGFRYDTVIADGRLLTKIRFFDVYDVRKGRYLDYNDRIKAIARADLEAVPQLYFGKWQGKELMYPFAEGPSMLNPKHVREGWVLNTRYERYEERLQSRMQVKLVGEGYNLQK